MTLTTIEKRALTHVGANIRQAISVLEARFGGVLTHDSGHGKYTGDVATTWIFTFPRHHGAQVAVPMNKQKLVFLMRGKTLDEQALEPLIADIALVTHRYTNATQGVASSVLGRRAPFLNPSVRNPLLRVIPQVEKVAQLLEIYLADKKGEGLAEHTLPTVHDGESTAEDRRIPLSAEEFERRQERNSEVGKLGELIAVQDELERLRQCGCHEPEKFVSRVAVSDVARGYDVESTWPGQERCIEVKASTQQDSDFYLTVNERRVLSELANRAWLYRVWVQEDGRGTVTARVSDPMRRINDSDFVPVVWRIQSSGLTNVASPSFEQ
ncbi:DUF3883 domain-containing protein [Paraburkholderia hospita]|uniref:DUF3883 domain-containing protein n=1 Tax=Paraburkholderia hospita TaxID=169430 RepID=UPI003ECEB517